MTRHAQREAAEEERVLEARRRDNTIAIRVRGLSRPSSAPKIIHEGA